MEVEDSVQMWQWIAQRKKRNSLEMKSEWSNIYFEIHIYFKPTSLNLATLLADTGGKKSRLVAQRHMWITKNYGNETISEPLSCIISNLYSEPLSYIII